MSRKIMVGNINNLSNAQINFTGKKKKEKNRGIIPGMVATSAVGLSSIPASQYLMKSMQNVSNSITGESHKVMMEAVDKAFTNSKVAEKGVTLLRIGPETEIFGLNQLKEAVSKITKNKKWQEAIINQISPLNAVKNGKNAAYAPLCKKIILPAEKLSTAGFHEIGHAMNANFSKIGKILQKSRMPLMALSGLIGLAAVTSKTKKAKDGEELKTKDKFKNFIRNNAGKLTFAAFLPTIIEEGMATFKGEKLAKKLLSPELMKKVTKGNRFGFATYVLSAAVSGIAAMCGVKVKDYFQAKYDSKQAAKNPVETLAPTATTSQPFVESSNRFAKYMKD